MTRISYIHGPKQVPANELPDRGRQVVKTARAYIPYTALTRGEMRLALLREQASIMAAAYPDFPEYARALAMIDNALQRGVSNGTPFVGQVPDSLQNVAYEIAAAANDSGPAAGDFYARPARLRGIGEPIIPESITESCGQYATRKANQRFGKSWTVTMWKLQPGRGSEKQYWLQMEAQCAAQKAIEQAMNARLESSAHHVLYKDIASGYTAIAGSRMDIKRLLHLAGVGALGNAAEVGRDMMSTWAEVGILRANAGAGVGPLPSVNSGFIVATSGDDAELQKYMNWLRARKQDKMNGIGEPLTVAAIVGLVVSALGAATALLSEINRHKATVMAAANGFGTPAYSAERGDFTAPAPDGAGGISPALLLGGAAALYLLTEK